GADRLDVLAGDGAGQPADDRHQAAPALRLDAEHGEAGLGVVERDALDDAAEGFGHTPSFYPPLPSAGANRTSSVRSSVIEWKRCATFAATYTTDPTCTGRSSAATCTTARPRTT